MISGIARKLTLAIHTFRDTILHSTRGIMIAAVCVRIHFARQAILMRARFTVKLACAIHALNIHCRSDFAFLIMCAAMRNAVRLAGTLMCVIAFIALELAHPI